MRGAGDDGGATGSVVVRAVQAYMVTEPYITHTVTEPYLNPCFVLLGVCVVCRTTAGCSARWQTSGGGDAKLRPVLQHRPGGHARATFRWE